MSRDDNIPSTDATGRSSIVGIAANASAFPNIASVLSCSGRSAYRMQSIHSAERLRA